MHTHTHTAWQLAIHPPWPFVCLHLHGLNTPTYTIIIVASRGHPWTLFIHYFGSECPERWWIDNIRLSHDFSLDYKIVCEILPRERRHGKQENKSDRHAGVTKVRTISAGSNSNKRLIKACIGPAAAAACWCSCLKWQTDNNKSRARKATWREISL